MTQTRAGLGCLTAMPNESRDDSRAMKSAIATEFEMVDAFLDPRRPRGPQSEPALRESRAGLGETSFGQQKKKHELHKREPSLHGGLVVRI